MKTLMAGRWRAREYQKPLLAYLEGGGLRADVVPGRGRRRHPGRAGERQRRLQGPSGRGPGRRRESGDKALGARPRGSVVRNADGYGLSAGVWGIYDPQGGEDCRH